VKLLDFDYVGATPLVAERLQIAAGDSVQSAIRIWNGEAGPFNHLSTFVPAALGRQWTREDLEHRTLVSLLQSSGVKISRAEENITATLADDVAAASLEVAPGSALLKISRTVYGEQDRPVEFLVALYPPDRYQYTLSLGGSAERAADLEPQPAR
jgi:GntR family transcriptional regulator